MKNKISYIAKKSVNKIYWNFICFLNMFLLNTNIVFASHFNKIKKSSGDVTSAAKPMAQNLLVIVKYAGQIILVWGIGEFIMSWMNEDANAKKNAIYKMVGGVLLILGKEMILSVAPNIGI